MDTTKQLIDLLAEEEFIRLKRLVADSNTRSDVHNIALLEAHKTYDIEAINLLRNKIGSNAFHALSKRLRDTLVNFIGATAVADGASEEQVVRRLIAAARAMLEHKLYKPAFKCLSKAEALATAAGHFALRNEVYLLWIQYAHYQAKVSLGALLIRHADNRKMMDTEERLNLAYAVLRQALEAIYHKGMVTDFAILISDTFKRFGLEAPKVYSYRSLYQLLFILNEQASVRQDYTMLLPYLEESYAFIKSKEAVPGQLYYRIQILYFLANACLRNRRFKDCRHYLDEMHGQMLEHNGRYLRRFNGRDTLLKALNANYSGAPGDAEAILANALATAGDMDAADVADLRLAASVLCLQHDDRTVVTHMRELMRTDGWYEKHMGRDWLIKKVLVEIIMQAELGNSEIALTRIAGFQKKFGSYLEDVGEERVLTFTALISQHIRFPEQTSETVFREAAERLVQGREQDLFVLSFGGWLLAKARRRPVYDVTLNLVNDVYFSPSHSA